MRKSNKILAQFDDVDSGILAEYTKGISNENSLNINGSIFLKIVFILYIFFSIALLRPRRQIFLGGLIGRTTDMFHLYSFYWRKYITKYERR